MSPPRKEPAVYNYEASRRRKIAPIPLSKQPPVPNPKPYNTISEQLRDLVPECNATPPKKEVIPVNTNIEVGSVPIFKYDQAQQQLYTVLELRNLSPRPLVFRVTTTSDFRFKSDPPIGNIRPDKSVLVTVIADHEEFRTCWKSFFQENIFIETVDSPKIIRKRPDMVSYLKRYVKNVKTTILDEFKLYRMPAGFPASEYESLDMIQDYDAFLTGEHYQEEATIRQVMKEASDVRDTLHAASEIIKAAMDIYQQIPTKSPLSIQPLRILGGVCGICFFALVIYFWMCQLDVLAWWRV